MSNKDALASRGKASLLWFSTYLDQLGTERTLGVRGFSYLFPGWGHIQSRRAEHPREGWAEGPAAMETKTKASDSENEKQ